MERRFRFVMVPVAAFVLLALLVPPTIGCGENMPNGTQFGFVHEMRGGKLIFDPAEFLTGDAALASYRALGEEPVEPYYIENPNVDKLQLRVAPDARFSLLAYDSTGAPTREKVLTYDELAQLWATGRDDRLMSAGFSSQELGPPMYLTMSASRVTGGKEQYLP